MPLAVDNADRNFAFTLWALLVPAFRTAALSVRRNLVGSHRRASHRALVDRRVPQTKRRS
jgi:hypothetical protein